MNIDLADTKYQKPRSTNQKNSRNLLSTILILVFLGVLTWIGFLFFQKTNLEKENARYQISIDTTTNRIKELTRSDNPAKKIAIAKILKKLESRRLPWSEIMKKIVKLESPGITFLDFEVEKEGAVSAVITARNFNALQQFVAKLNTNEKVSQIVLNSIQLDENTASLKVSMDFNLNLK